MPLNGAIELFHSVMITELGLDHLPTVSGCVTALIATMDL